MNKSNRIILSFLILIFCLLVEGVILWLFPYTGLGGLICWPLALFFGILFGFIIFKFTKAFSKKWIIFLFILVIVTSYSYFQLSILPQDFGGSTFEKIKNAKEAYSKYEKIKFYDFPKLTNFERVAYSYKFQNKLPKSFIILTIDSLKDESESLNPRVYLIQNTDKGRIYDKSKINFVETDSNTFIYEYYHQKDTLIYNMHKNFLNIGSGGYNDRIISLDIYEDDLKPDTGIEKILYFIIKLTK